MLEYEPWTVIPEVDVLIPDLQPFGLAGVQVPWVAGADAVALLLTAELVAKAAAKEIILGIVNPE